MPQSQHLFSPHPETMRWAVATCTAGNGPSLCGTQLHAYQLSVWLSIMGGNCKLAPCRAAHSSEHHMILPCPAPL